MSPGICPGTGRSNERRLRLLSNAALSPFPFARGLEAAFIPAGRRCLLVSGIVVHHLLDLFRDDGKGFVHGQVNALDLVACAPQCGKRSSAHRTAQRLVPSSAFLSPPLHALMADEMAACKDYGVLIHLGLKLGDG